MSSSLINKGIVSLGNKKEADLSKIVVVGSARGGTSLVAGVLDKLGVFMGGTSAPPVYEDIRLSKHFEAKDFDAAKKLINEYSSECNVLGWKRPSSINYLPVVDRTFDKPAYIFIYKDLISIAQRNAISMLSEVMSGMSRASQEYENSIRFLSENDSYALLVSYEKALSNPEYFVDSVIKFCELSPSSLQKDDAIRFISPNPADYLDESRITKINGRLDKISEGRVYGWARYIHPSMSIAVNVELYFNDELLATVVANSFRQDLNKSFSFNKNCAFEYKLPESLIVNKSDLFHAKIKDDSFELKNSPLPLI